jgi:hypothetical protein
MTYTFEFDRPYFDITATIINEEWVLTKAFALGYEM